LDSLHKLYMIAKFSPTKKGAKDGMWATPEGSTLQQWMQDNKIPLIWSDGDNSGMLIDAVVDWIGFDQATGKYITDADKDYLKKSWGTAGIDFSTVYKGASAHLQMEYRSWFNKDICGRFETQSYLNIMGVVRLRVFTCSK
jgi:hypothetical protein